MDSLLLSSPSLMLRLASLHPDAALRERQEMARRNLKWVMLFLTLTTFVGLASALDAYLNLQYPVVVASEENPMAAWILKTHGNGNHARAVLIGLKFGGTLLVLQVLWMLFARKRTRRWAWIVVVALTIVQLAVLYYITDGFTFI